MGHLALDASEQKLVAPEARSNDSFGESVDVDGNVALVGARVDFDTDRSGSAYVYRFDGSNWLQEQKLTASDATLGNQFGDSVSISGNTALIGAHRDDQSTGSAYVFQFDGTSWNQQQK